MVWPGIIRRRNISSFLIIPTASTFGSSCSSKVLLMSMIGERGASLHPCRYFLHSRPCYDCRRRSPSSIDGRRPHVEVADQDATDVFRMETSINSTVGFSSFESGMPRGHMPNTRINASTVADSCYVIDHDAHSVSATMISPVTMMREDSPFISVG